MMDDEEIMIEPPPDLVGMEDIMEVIYSFRCKFCSFTAHSPHEISSHVQKVHLKKNALKSGTSMLKNYLIEDGEAPQVELSLSPASPRPEPVLFETTSDNIETEVTEVTVVGLPQADFIDEGVVTQDVDENMTSVAIAVVDTTETQAPERNENTSTVDGELQIVNASQMVSQAAQIAGVTETDFNIQIEDRTKNSVETETMSISPVAEVVGVQTDGLDMSALTSGQLVIHRDMGMMVEGQEEDESQLIQVVDASMLEEVDTVTEVLEEATIRYENVTKALYVCGQCQQGYASMQQCKQHMTDDHNFSFTSSGVAISTEEGETINLPTCNKTSVGTQASTYKKPGRKKKSETAIKVEEVEEESEYDKREVTVTRSGRRAQRLPKTFHEECVMSDTKPRGKHKAKNTPADLLCNSSLRCHFTFCTAKFQTAESMAVHLQCHVEQPCEKGGNESMPFTCYMCQQGFLEWCPLREHLWKEHQVDTDFFKCQVIEGCNFRTDTLSKLQVHKRTHKNEKPYSCEHCGDCFKQPNQLKTHENVHAVELKQRGRKRLSLEADCDTCGRTFANRKCLKKHIEAVHDKVKPFRCLYCDHTTSRKGMMQLHMRMHTGDKPFKCEECDYTTSDHNTLRRHRMRHTGQRPYGCSLCTYTCIQSISLKTHMKNKHPGVIEQGIYSCLECNFRSVNYKSFLNHQRDHKLGLVSQSDVVHEVKPRGKTKNGEKKTRNYVSIPVDSIKQNSAKELADDNAEQQQAVYSVTEMDGQLVYTRQLSTEAIEAIQANEATETTNVSFAGQPMIVPADYTMEQQDGDVAGQIITLTMPQELTDMQGRGELVLIQDTEPMVHSSHSLTTQNTQTLMETESTPDIVYIKSPDDVQLGIEYALGDQAGKTFIVSDVNGQEYEAVIENALQSSVSRVTEVGDHNTVSLQYHDGTKEMVALANVAIQE